MREDLLAGAVIDPMKQTGMPNGFFAVGYTEADLDGLVGGTFRNIGLLNSALGLLMSMS